MSEAMWALLKRVGSWAGNQFAGLGLILVLGVIASALWLFVEDKVDFELNRESLRRAVAAERDHLLIAKQETDRRTKELLAEAIGARNRQVQAERLLEQLNELNSGWNGWWREKEEREVLERRIQRVEAIRKAALEEVSEKQKLAVLEGYKASGIRIALEKSEKQMMVYEQSRSRIFHYLDAAWEKVKWHVLALVGIWFLGPPLYKVFAYFVLAPWISRRKGVHLGLGESMTPAVSESLGVLDISIWPGEVLRAREETIRGSDEGLVKKGRWLFDWSMPLASFATGLTDLVEMRHPHAGGAMKVSLGGGDQEFRELAVVEVPDGGALVLRPRFLLGVVLPVGVGLKIRRRWSLNRWASWMTGQFRHYEFVGPCRLIISGSKGVRAEHLEAREEGVVPARRTQSELLVGFSPTLELRLVRSETFWAYLRGKRTLFESVFSGVGVYLVQGKAVRDGNNASTRWSSRFSDVLLRLVGF